MLIESSHCVRDSSNFLSHKYQRFGYQQNNQRHLGADLSNIDPHLSSNKPLLPKSLKEAELVIRDLSLQNLSLQEELDMFILENDRLKLQLE